MRLLVISVLSIMFTVPAFAEDKKPKNGADDGPIKAAPVDDTDRLPTKEVPPPPKKDETKKKESKKPAAKKGGDKKDAPKKSDAKKSDGKKKKDKPEPPEPKSDKGKKPADDGPKKDGEDKKVKPTKKPVKKPTDKPAKRKPPKKDGGDKKGGDKKEKAKPPEPKLGKDEKKAAGTKVVDRRRGHNPDLPRHLGKQVKGVIMGNVAMNHKTKEITVPFATTDPKAAPPIRAIFRVMVAKGDKAKSHVAKTGHVYTDNGATFELRRPVGSDAKDPRRIEIFVVHIVLQSEDVVFRGREWVVVLQWVDTLQDLGVDLKEAARQLGKTEKETAQLLGVKP